MGTLATLWVATVVEGSPGFTDSLSSYHGLLSKRSSNVCIVVCIILKVWKVSLADWRNTFGSKAWVELEKRSYKHFLAEFLWRQRCSAFSKDLFSNFVDTCGWERSKLGEATVDFAIFCHMNSINEITAWKDAHPQKTTFEDSVYCRIKFQMSITRTLSPWENRVTHPRPWTRRTRSPFALDTGRIFMSSYLLLGRTPASSKSSGGIGFINIVTPKDSRGDPGVLGHIWILRVQK